MKYVKIKVRYKETSWLIAKIDAISRLDEKLTWPVSFIISFRHLFF